MPYRTVRVPEAYRILPPIRHHTTHHVITPFALAPARAARPRVHARVLPATGRPGTGAASKPRSQGVAFCCQHSSQPSSRLPCSVSASTCLSLCVSSLCVYVSLSLFVLIHACNHRWNSRPSPHSRVYTYIDVTQVLAHSAPMLAKYVE